MATSVASVAFIEGQAWARASDGSMRQLSLGDTLNADEVLITAEGARVELDFGDNQQVAFTGNQEVGMGPDLWEVTVTDRNEAEIVDETVEQVLALLEENGDLLEELEETAAGGGESSAGGGSNFVQVERISVENPDGPSFDFGEVVRSSGSGTLLAAGAAGNQPPQADDQFIRSPEDTPITGRVTATDPDNDPLTWSLLTSPASGAVTLNPDTGEFVYIPNPDFHGADSFVVVVTDPRGNSETARVNLEITPVNDAPESSDLSLTTPQDTPVDGQVIATDRDGDELVYGVSNPPANGSVTLNPGTGEFTYTPDPGYHGGDRFVVIIDDGQGGTTTSVVTIGVTPVAEPPVVEPPVEEPPVVEPPVEEVNTPPVASNLTLTTPEDTPVSGRIAASDADGDTLNFAVGNPPAQGSIISFNPATGAFVYQPGAGYVGNDQFTVTVSDGRGGSTVAVVNIGITPVEVVPPVNQSPTSSDVSLTTEEDTPVDGAVPGADVDGDTLQWQVTSGPAHGTVTLDKDTGHFTYTPGAHYHGGDSFVVTISDGQGGSTTSTVTIEVTPVNENPVAVDDPAGEIYSVVLGTHNTGLTGQAAWATPDSEGQTVVIRAWGPDNVAGTLVYEGTKMGVQGTPRSNAAWGLEEPNQLEYDITTGKSEAITLEFNGNLTSASVQITNLVANEQGGVEQGVWTAYYQGQVVASNTFRFTGSNSAGEVQINTGGRVFDSLRFTALDNFNNNGDGDGSGYFLNGFKGEGSAEVNNPYTINSSSALSIAADKGLLANDADGDGGSLSVTHINGVAVANGETVSLASGASLTIFQDGSFIYDDEGAFGSLPAGAYTADSFTYSISDGQGGYAEATATVSVISTGPVPSPEGRMGPLGLFADESIALNLAEPDEDEATENRGSEEPGEDTGESLNAADILPDDEDDAPLLPDDEEDSSDSPSGVGSEPGVSLDNFSLNLTPPGQDIVEQLKSGNPITD